ncbi:hypothetical protein LXL04_011155 [Taraxacum kok-saghyz]
MAFESMVYPLEKLIYRQQSRVEDIGFCQIEKLNKMGKIRYTGENVVLRSLYLAVINGYANNNKFQVRITLKSTSYNLKRGNADKEEIKPVKRVPEVVAGGKQRQREKEVVSEERSDNEIGPATRQKRGVGRRGRRSGGRSRVEVVGVLEWRSSPE